MLLNGFEWIWRFLKSAYILSLELLETLSHSNPPPSPLPKERKEEIWNWVLLWLYLFIYLFWFWESIPLLFLLPFLEKKRKKEKKEENFFLLIGSSEDHILVLVLIIYLLIVFLTHTHKNKLYNKFINVLFIPLPSFSPPFSPNPFHSPPFNFSFYTHKRWWKIIHNCMACTRMKS